MLRIARAGVAAVLYFPLLALVIAGLGLSLLLIAVDELYERLKPAFEWALTGHVE